MAASGQLLEDDERGGRTPLGGKLVDCALGALRAQGIGWNARIGAPRRLAGWFPPRPDVELALSQKGRPDAAQHLEMRGAEALALDDLLCTPVSAHASHVMLIDSAGGRL
jgi:hypothetical protein